MIATRPLGRWGPWLWIVALGAVTGVMIGVRGRLQPVHVALAYLLVVQLAAARGGRPVGLTTAALSFLAFNWFFLPPYGTLALANPLDWLVLFAFLFTAAASAELLYRAQALGAERVQRAAEAERARMLEQSHQAKDALLASVSHDLRTPLTTIKGLAHEIATGGDERAEVIEEESDRLEGFVGKLLDLSRVAMGTAALDIQPNEAEDLLGAAVQQAQAPLRGHPLTVHVEPPGALLFGRFDFAQTLRVVVNLLENAGRYSPAAAPIDLGARRMGAELQFWVADRGPGIPEPEREAIFEPFHRTPGTTPGGTGLGLAIARGIAEAQGGRITLSPRDGGGSVFTLALPAVDLDEAPEP